MSRNLPRLFVLAAAALASVATSELPTSTYVDEASPFHGQTAVPADVQPTVVISVESDASDPGTDDLQLFTAGRVPVAGHVQRTRMADPFGGRLFELRFLPDAPLAPGDYRLVVRATYANEALIEGDDLDEHVAEFSTLSRPTILGAGLGSPHLYFELSQAVDVESLRAHVSAFDATGDALPVGEVSQAAGQRFVYTVALPVGVVAVDIADGVLAADGTPVLGLPAHFEAI